MKWVVCSRSRYCPVRQAKETMFLNNFLLLDLKPVKLFGIYMITHLISFRNSIVSLASARFFHSHVVKLNPMYVLILSSLFLPMSQRAIKS